MQSFLIITFCLVSVISVTVTGNDDDVEEAFVRSGIVPYVIRNAPKEQCVVNYAKSGIVVRIGELLRNNDTAEEPLVQFNYRDGRFYTIFLIDPDAPTPEAPIFREYRHWILGNVQGGDSYPLVVYKGPAPPSAAPHRYIVLVYEQPGSLCFDEPRITNQMNMPTEHWILGNVQGGDSYPLVVYKGPAPRPRPRTGTYIVLVYEQPGSLCFDEPRITNQTPEVFRYGFRVQLFIEKYNLRGPVCGTFFYGKANY